MQVSFVTRIQQQLDALPKTERRLAEFMLDFPGNLAGYSASELAGLTGVSNATVSRFIRRLGYDSYDEARRHARSEAQAGSPLFTQETTAPASHAEPTLQAYLHKVQAQLGATLAGISQEQLHAIAKALLAARNVVYLGFRQNRNFAAYLRWQLLQVLPTAQQCLPGAGETLGEYLALVGRQDMVVLFALRRSVPLARRFAEQARAQGAQVLVITDGLSEAPPATWLLRAQAESDSAFDNHASLMMLCHLISSHTLALAGQAGRRQLAEIEVAHDRLGEM